MRSPSHHHAETLPNTEVRLQGDEVPVVEGGLGVLGMVLLDKGISQSIQVEAVSSCPSMVAQYSPVLLPLDDGKVLAQVGEGLAGSTRNVSNLARAMVATMLPEIRC